MPAGNPIAYGGPMMGMQMGNGGMDVLAVMQRIEEEKRAREQQGLLTLLGGLGLLGMTQGGKGGGAGKRGQGGQGGQSGQGGQGGMSVSRGPGGARRNAAGALAKMAGVSAGKTKGTDPMSLASAPGAVANVAGEGTKAAWMASPVVGASIAGGATLLDGLIGGGEGDELQKKQIKTNRQESLFGSIQLATEGIRRRNEELRSTFGR